MFWEYQTPQVAYAAITLDATRLAVSVLIAPGLRSPAFNHKPTESKSPLFSNFPALPSRRNDL